MRNLSFNELARKIDISCVKSFHSLQDINAMAAAARKYHFICVFALPSLTPYLIEQLKEEPGTLVGGAIGFPSGGETTATKVAQVHELIRMGCRELDMVINLAQLKSHKEEAVFSDIYAVVKAAGEMPVKTILEVTALTQDEIIRGCEIAVEAGAAFIKTGTGWMAEPTTLQHIHLIKSTIGNRAQIKAAGGIRDLRTLMEMYEAGCDRFGVGVESAIKIMEQAGEQTI